MKRHIGLGTIALSLFACGPHTTIHETSAGGGVAPIASGQDVSAPRAEPDAPPPRAWIWRVSGGDSSTYSYVLGTLHEGIALATALPPAYATHLAAARTIVLDVDLRELPQALVASGQAHTRGARPLDRLLGRESWARVTTELGAAQLQTTLLRTLTPSALTIYLQQVRVAEAEAAVEGREPIAGTPSSDGLDGAILDEGTRRGVPVVQLETPAEGLASLTTLPDADQLAVLHHVIDQPDDARQQAAAMRDAYVAFDEIAIAQALAAAWTPEQRQVLAQRNQAWAAALAAQLHQGNAFIAISIDRVIGGGGVLELLRAQGYTVERLGQ